MYILLLFNIIYCTEQNYPDDSMFNDCQFTQPLPEPFPFIVGETITIRQTTHGQIPYQKKYDNYYQPFVCLEIPKGYYIVLSDEYNDGYYEIKTDEGYIYRKMDPHIYALTTFGTNYAGKIYVKNYENSMLYYSALSLNDLMSETFADCQLMVHLPSYEFSSFKTKNCFFDPNQQTLGFKILGEAGIKLTYPDTSLNKIYTEQTSVSSGLISEKTGLGPSRFYCRLEITSLSIFGDVKLWGSIDREIILFPSQMPNEYQSYVKTSDEITYVDPFKLSERKSMKIYESGMTYSPDLNTSDLEIFGDTVAFCVKKSVVFHTFPLSFLQYIYFDAGTNRVSGGIINNFTNHNNILNVFFYTGNFDNFTIDIYLDNPVEANNAYSICFEDESIQSIPKIRTTITFQNAILPDTIKSTCSLQIKAKSKKLQARILEACVPFANLTDYPTFDGKISFNSYLSFEDDYLYLVYEIKKKTTNYVGIIIGVVVAVVVVIVVVVVVIVCVIKKKKAKQSSEASGNGI